MSKRWLVALFVAVITTLSASLWAQGVQTGVLTGKVTSADGIPIADAIVSVRSSHLQGVRTVRTDNRGAYIFKGLPAGDYDVTFEAPSVSKQERKATISVGGTLDVDVTMQPAAESEVLTVLASPDSAQAQTPQGGQNFRTQETDRLPISRDPVNIAELAPGLTSNTPNSGQLAISGGFAYETQFLVDGVDIADNTFGTINHVYIEDAIQEVEVLTSGISAEYGRFGSGVVNAITKSGGNEFTGSVRTDLTNPRWTKLTPFEIENDRPKPENKVQPTYQATLGGYLVKDRLWFFTAGRLRNRDSAKTFDQTGIPYTEKSDDKRFEVKLTGNLTPQHSLQATYSKDSEDDTRTSLPNSLDPATLESPHFPTDLLQARYTGSLRPNLFVEAQYSRKKEGFRNSGATSKDIHDSPFLPANLPGDNYNAPYFDATDPQDRDNRQITGAVSYFLTSKSLGNHDLKGGVELFRTSNTGGNSQSSTSYVFLTDYLTDSAGKPVVQDNRVVPTFTPGSSLLLNWRAQRGAELDITTNSFYVNDRWTLDSHWSFNLGLRYERVRSEATGGLVGVDTDTIVPRLAASYDVSGDGKWRVDATYGHYAGKYNDSQFSNNTNVANPNLVYGVYVGPAGSGRDFAPGFNSANYQTVGGFFPTVNAVFDKNLSSPVTKELSFGLGHVFARGFAKAIYTHRRVTNFVEDFTNLSNGTVTVDEGGEPLVTLTKRVYINTDIPKREYDAAQLLAQYRAFSHLWMTASYTLQLRNNGDFEGEARSQPAITSNYGDFPEVLTARSEPFGRLSAFQRHKLRLYANYTFDFAGKGALDLGILYSFDSPLTYSLAASTQPLSSIQKARDPGYPDLPTQQTLYFGERGSELYNASHIFGLALNYSVPVIGRVHPYVKAELRNVFNAQPLISFDTTIKPDPKGPLDADGLPTTFIKGSKFGQGTATTDYPTPRTFQFALGFRF